MTATQCLIDEITEYKKIIFEVPGEVVGKGRPRFTNVGGYVRTYTPAKTKDYEKSIKIAYLKNNKYKSEKALRAKIFIYKAIPKLTTKKTKEAMLTGKILCTKKPDVDNVAKIVLDALNKVAYEDDTQVTELAIIRKWAVNENLKVIIEEIGNIK